METQAVRSVLNSYWDGLLPVKPDTIAEKMGIEVKPLNTSRNPGVSGMAEILNDGRKIIGYNRADSYSRIRFTLAHELGHHILGHTASYDRCFRDYPEDHNNSNSWIEREANKFAAELLMPEQALKIMIEREAITDIEELAYHFDVSSSAMYWRLKNLGYPI
ncbi:ImmA/IrrE family metallo-endopeptidase [Rahnella variigena]|uniref:ImmA/IrrE family metallo-endopeptidase n=1 Tax=Rahnella variigena TaxID=574964 RepID=UPI003D265D3E